MSTRHITEGQTQPVTYTISRVGGDVIDLTSVNKVEVTLAPLRGESSDDGTLSYNSDDDTEVVISDADAGQVTVDLSALKASNSPYVIRFWVWYDATLKEPAPPEPTELVEVHA